VEGSEWQVGEGLASGGSDWKVDGSDWQVEGVTGKWRG